MRALLMVLMCSVTLAAQQPAPATVTNQDLLAGLPADGSKWLLYHGNYAGHRFSPLTQITPQNVNQLKAQWTFQTRLTPNFQTTPLLVDNVLYVTGFNGTAWAIDARSGRQIWAYRRNMPDDFRGCCGPNNRGFAVGGDKLFLGTGDAHLVALDMKTGDVVWDV
jgi:alcohol dehydrogenase (cytochrome c)